MPRASRYLREGCTFHLTHRCHNRRFLLKFARDRDVCREWLRVAIKRYGVPVYGYCLTSNHVHLVVHGDDCERVGLLMYLAAGAFAQHLNRRKGFEGSVWEHPYQCTIIQDGQHLLRCLRYVDLNMVRAGVVTHPAQWRWCGYDELIRVQATIRRPSSDPSLLSKSQILTPLLDCHPGENYHARDLQLQLENKDQRPCNSHVSPCMPGTFSPVVFY